MLFLPILLAPILALAADRPRIRRAPAYVVLGENFLHGPGSSKKMPEDARRFWEHLGEAEEGVALYQNGLVGWFRYAMDLVPRYDTGATLYPAGTWVHSDFRGRGYGLLMWRYVLNRKTDITKVRATIVSDGGMALINAVKKDFPNIKFYVDDWRS
jgi:GNAT superfamily N-acetyltransferase